MRCVTEANARMLVVVCTAALCAAAMSAQSVAGGGRHTVVRCADGSAMAWGFDRYGQLAVPDVAVASVGAGLMHTIVIDADGVAHASGSNGAGQCGNGTLVDATQPTRMLVSTAVRAATGGSEHSLLVDVDGHVWVCGRNVERQLGLGTRTLTESTPIRLELGVRIRAVAAGAEHSLFLLEDGTVLGCGSNGHGQLGLPRGTSPSVPTAIPGLTGITHVSAGEWHSVFVRSDGVMLVCGRDHTGQLGLGAGEDQYSVTPVQGLPFIVHADAGGLHTVATSVDGFVYAMGTNSNGNNDGQLGCGTRDDRRFPVRMTRTWPPERTAVAAHASREHSVIVLDDGQLYATGRNNYDQLGTGTATVANALEPVASTAVCRVAAQTVGIETDHQPDIDDRIVGTYDIYGRRLDVDTSLDVRVRGPLIMIDRRGSARLVWRE